MILRRVNWIDTNKVCTKVEQVGNIAGATCRVCQGIGINSVGSRVWRGSGWLVVKVYILSFEPQHWDLLRNGSPCWWDGWYYTYIGRLRLGQSWYRSLVRTGSRLVAWQATNSQFTSVRLIKEVRSLGGVLEIPSSSSTLSCSSFVRLTLITMGSTSAMTVAASVVAAVRSVEGRMMMI